MTVVSSTMFPRGLVFGVHHGPDVSDQKIVFLIQCKETESIVAQLPYSRYAQNFVHISKFEPTLARCKPLVYSRGSLRDLVKE